MLWKKPPNRRIVSFRSDSAIQAEDTLNNVKTPVITGFQGNVRLCLRSVVQQHAERYS